MFLFTPRDFFENSIVKNELKKTFRWEVIPTKMKNYKVKVKIYKISYSSNGKSKSTGFLEVLVLIGLDVHGFRI